MRVTQSSSTRNYMRTLNKNLESMNKINKKITTERNFSRASEDTISATRAMKTRRSLADTQIYEDNLKTSESILKIGEDVIKGLSETNQKVKEKFVAAITGTNSHMEREIFASELDEIIQDTVKILNSDYAGRFVFSGTNNGKPPFEYDKKAGVIRFNGIDINGERNPINSPLNVSSTKYKLTDTSGNNVSFENGTITAVGSQLQFLPKGGNPATDTVQLRDANLAKHDILTMGITDKAYGTGVIYADAGGLGIKTTGFPYTDPILVDVGLGMSVKRYDIDGNLTATGDFYKIDPQSGLNIGLNGSNIIGAGSVDDEGHSSSTLGLILDMKKALEGDNFSSAVGRRILNKFDDASQNVLIAISEIGNRTAFITSNLDRITDNRLVYQTDQVEIEATNLPEAMTDFKSVERLYTASLQMGSKLLSPSIFDFIR